MRPYRKEYMSLYLDGNGVRRIQDIMEQEGRITATGLTKWSSSNISRILKNSFYCGRIEYRKEYVPDYLTQKKVINHGVIEKIYVEGNHEPIITPEMYDEAISMVGDLLDVKSNETNDKKKVENNIKQIDKLRNQISMLVDMCTQGDISREMFQKKKAKLEKQISNLEKSNEECQQEMLESENDILKQERMVY